MNFVALCLSATIFSSTVTLNGAAPTRIADRDINTDGYTDWADFDTLCNLILDGEYWESADVNNDGVIDARDVVQLKIELQTDWGINNVK